MRQRDGWIRVSLEMVAGLFVVIASGALFNLVGWSQSQAVGAPVPPYDISVDKTANPDPEVIAGTVLTYTVKVANTVSPTAHVKLNDVIDPTTVAKFHSLAVPSGMGWVCTKPAWGGPATGFDCKSASLPADSMGTFTMVVTIPPSVANGTVITNTVSVQPEICPSWGPCDANWPSNNRDVVTTTVKTRADLSFTKTAEPEGPIFPGTPLKYTLTVTNNGPSDAQNVKITDPTTPPNSAFLFATPSAGGACMTTPAVGAAGKVECTFAGATPPGGMHSVLIAVKACTEAPCGELTNVGSASSSTFDPDGANDSSTVGTQVAPVPAPALSPAGLFLAVLALFAVGGWALLRRRPAPH